MHFKKIGFNVFYVIMKGVSIITNFLQRFLRKLKQRNFFDEIEWDKLYPSGSAPACIYGTPKMNKFSSSDSFSKLHPIVSSIGTFSYNLARFLCDLH